jgi:recombination protein RecR
LNEPLDEVIKLLARLPGVGRRTATRHAYTILRRGEAYGLELAEAVSRLVRETKLCERCHNHAAEALCRTCTDTKRDARRVCVVQTPPDVSAIESSGAWDGVFHVLHGVIAPLDGIGPGDLKIHELIGRIGAEPIEEVVLATGASVEGEATALYISRLLSDSVAVTRLARGLPAGSDLEHMDAPTLARAFEGRAAL